MRLQINTFRYIAKIAANSRAIRKVIKASASLLTPLTYIHVGKASASLLTPLTYIHVGKTFLFRLTSLTGTHTDDVVAGSFNLLNRNHDLLRGFLNIPDLSSRLLP